MEADVPYHVYQKPPAQQAVICLHNSNRYRLVLTWCQRPQSCSDVLQNLHRLIQIEGRQGRLAMIVTTRPYRQVLAR